MVTLEYAPKASLAVVYPSLVLVAFLQRSKLLDGLQTNLREDKHLSDKSAAKLTLADGATFNNFAMFRYFSKLASRIPGSPGLPMIRHKPLSDFRKLSFLTFTHLVLWADTILGNHVALSSIRKTENNVARAISSASTKEKVAARAATSAAGVSHDIDFLGITGPVTNYFSPKPSAYLHIGHAKAVLLNDHFAHIRPGGRLLCHFDDTILRVDALEHGKGDEDRKNRLFSKRRDLSIDETLAQFEEMKIGDFCAPILDSIEGVTVPLHFSRLNFVRTLLSKRKLTRIVDEGKVWGLVDPRMQLIRDTKRRGVVVPAWREFILKQDPSRNIVNLEWGTFWATNRKYIDPAAPRHTTIESSGAVTCMADAKFSEANEEITVMNWNNTYVRGITKDDKGNNFLTPMTEFRTQAFRDCINVAELPQGPIVQFKRKRFYKLDEAYKGEGFRAIFFEIPSKALY
ncbi:glutamyl-tRNA synthetase [Xylaria castorea]|nr:glutamyl-tRNA synthetase [Xylaria castorea]